MTTFTLMQLQEEMKPWVKHNFGDRPASQPLQGITEELGELMESFFHENPDDVGDALADCAIFLADYCNAAGVSMVAVQQESDIQEAIREHVWTGTQLDAAMLLYVLGKLNHHNLKKEQGIRKGEDHDIGILCRLAGVLNFLRACCRLFDGVTLEDLVEKTWSKVKQRDWKKNATTGA
jgi:NTP pyrophosphatase (non-canonical NTP hydrolase)